MKMHSPLIPDFVAFLLAAAAILSSCPGATADDASSSTSYFAVPGWFGPQPTPYTPGPSGVVGNSAPGTTGSAFTSPFANYGNPTYGSPFAPGFAATSGAMPYRFSPYAGAGSWSAGGLTPIGLGFPGAGLAYGPPGGYGGWGVPSPGMMGFGGLGIPGTGFGLGGMPGMGLGGFGMGGMGYLPGAGGYFPGMGFGALGGGWNSGFGGFHQGWGSGWGGYRGASGYGLGYGGPGGYSGFGGYGGGYGAWGLLNPGVMGAIGGMSQGNPEHLGEVGPHRAFQTTPSKASGNFYQPSTVDTTASGSYYASGTPAMTPVIKVRTSTDNDYWGSSGNPYGKGLNSVPWAK